MPEFVSVPRSEHKGPGLGCRPGIDGIKVDDARSIARRYERFATEEARGASPIYEQLALAVAGSAELLTFLSSVPSDRCRPTLFLAAVRHISGVPRNGHELEEIVRAHAPRVREIMLSRTTQTNEPARCSALLPVLAGLGEPLALIEVGASAGLCLLLDRYRYHYGRHRIEPPSAELAGAAPILECIANIATPLPSELPKVGWRLGLDLNPLDVNSSADMAWLETLVWPGQAHRTQNLRTAIEVARAHPPKVRKGDLRVDLPGIAALAPKDLRLVVYHTAVLGHVGSQSDREEFAKAVRKTGALWISNEAPSVFPELARSAPPPPSPGHFLLVVDGKPIAWTRPHGQSIDWFAG
jgi:hypothetical protein